MNKFVTYKNAQIHYSDIGKGDVVVLLHGFLEDVSMWDTIRGELVKTNRIVCVDLLGHGKSDCLGYVHTMEVMAEAVRFVLEVLNISKALFVGHSLGGYVALALAEKHLIGIDGLCLMNSTTQSDSEERIKLRNRAIKMAQVNYEPLVSMSINNLFSSETRALFLSEIEESRRVALKTTVQSYIATTKGMMQRSNKGVFLKKAKFKKLIIAGKKDPVLSYNSILEESERIDSELVTLSNGHMSHIENKLELISVLKCFVS